MNKKATFTSVLKNALFCFILLFKQIMMKKVLFILFQTFIFFHIYAQDSIFARKIICDLSSPAMFGRGYTYSGDSIAAAYLVNAFKEIGIQPLTTDYLQKYGFYAFSMEGKVQFKIGDRELSPFNDYRIAPFSSFLNGNFEIIQIDIQGFNNETTREKFLNKNQYDVKHQLIYIDISGKKWQEKERKKIVDKFLASISRKTSLNGLNCLLIGVNDLPVWSLGATDFERDFAVIYVRAELLKGKKKEKFFISFDNKFKYHNTQNIVGYLPGTQHPDSFYVFTAHYDHLGTMGDSVIFYGAHDNASGVAMVVDLANYFKKHQSPYSIVFMLLSGEEVGLKGSIYATLHPLFDFKKVKLLLNLDMQCGGDEGIMVVNSQANNTKNFYQKLVQINKENNYVTEVKSRPNAPNSDHYPFSFHMPAMFIYTLGGKIGGYHDFTDSCDRCSLQHYTGIFNLITQMVEASYSRNK